MSLEYSVQYYAAWVNAAVGLIAAVLAGAGLTLHPSWLSNDVAATAGVIALICGGLATILPAVQRTPGSREAKYVAAAAGELPKDLAGKHPTIMPT